MTIEIQDVPIVAARRVDGGVLRIACPFCHETHFHGSGGRKGPYMGHRMSHCIAKDLPPRLRERRSELGYHLIDAAVFKIIDAMFGELNKVADEVNPDLPTFVGYMEVELARLIRLRGLDPEQRRELLALWGERYLAKLRHREAARAAHMTGLMAERDRLLAERAAAPAQQRAEAIDARLAVLATAIAALAGAHLRPEAPMGRWAA